MSHMMSSGSGAVDQFMAWVDASAGNVGRCFFSYLIVRQNLGVALIKGALTMNSMDDLFPYCHRSISFENFTAGYLEIQGGKEAVIDFCANLVAGVIEVEGHKIRMAPGPGYSLTEIKIDDPEGMLPNSSARQPRCKLVGAMHQASFGLVTDWLLRAADPPYVSLQDLCTDYRLGSLSLNAVVDVVALQVAWTDQRSEIRDGYLHLHVALMKGLDRILCTVGYRMIGTNRPIRRGVFQPTQFTWKEEGDLWLGTSMTPVDPGDVVQCFTTYDGRAQHQTVVMDKGHPQNPRRAAYEIYDESLDRLRNWLAPPADQQGPKQHEFEFAVQTLGWLLGFGVQHLDRRFGDSKAPDGIFVCDAGFVVVECTVGPFGPDKLSKLLKRRNDVRERLAACGHSGVPVECVIAAPLTAQESAVERRSAAEYQVGFVARDNIADLLNKTYPLSNANQLFAELQRKIRENKELFDQDPSLV
ncbi:hypothetical protein [Dyella monticola]|nr:hypothetical protein [Dyella monticola]